MGVENDIFGAEIGWGFGEQGSTPQSRIPWIPPPPSLWDFQLSYMPFCEEIGSENYMAI